jgi:hypothetical protein
MSLIGHWQLNDGSGTTASDASGNGRNGTLSGCSWVASGLGGALQLDGVDDYVSVPDAAALRLTGDMSIALWFRYDNAVKNWQRLLGKGTSDARNYGLWVEGEDHRLMFQQQDANGDYCVCTHSTVGAGAWYHAAATVSGSDIKLYVNKVLVASGTRSGGPVTSTEPLVMGHVDGTAHDWLAFFDGKLDDARLYDHALSQAEVDAIYDAGSP